jgi:hypothetical protein
MKEKAYIHQGPIDLLARLNEVPYEQILVYQNIAFIIQ